jgi:hypothetical protein
MSVSTSKQKIPSGYSPFNEGLIGGEVTAEVITSRGFGATCRRGAAAKENKVGSADNSAFCKSRRSDETIDGIVHRKPALYL